MYRNLKSVVATLFIMFAAAGKCRRWASVTPRNWGEFRLTSLSTLDPHDQVVQSLCVRKVFKLKFLMDVRSLWLYIFVDMPTLVLKSLIERTVWNTPSRPKPSLLHADATRELMSLPPQFFPQNLFSEGNGLVDRQDSATSRVSGNDVAPLPAEFSPHVSCVTYVPTDEMKHEAGFRANKKG